MRFAARRCPFQTSLFTLRVLKWGQFSGLLYFLFNFFNFSSSIPQVNKEFTILANFLLTWVPSSSFEENSSDILSSNF